MNERKAVRHQVVDDERFNPAVQSQCYADPTRDVMFTHNKRRRRQTAAVL